VFDSILIIVNKTKETEMARRPYEELRHAIEKRGGKMSFERSGYPQGGAWILKLANKSKVIESNQSGFPELDRLYIPKKPNPRHYRDYTTSLVPDAINQLIAMLQ
jgi:hypothetical protein